MDKEIRQIRRKLRQINNILNSLENKKNEYELVWEVTASELTQQLPTIIPANHKIEIINGTIKTTPIQNKHELTWGITTSGVTCSELLSKRLKEEYAKYINQQIESIKQISEYYKVK